MSIITNLINTFFSVIPRAKPPVTAFSTTKLIAHRGAHDHKQQIFENTHAAFQRALDLGCWGIELDVHATADQVLVVHHDPTLWRLWRRREAIAQLTFAQLNTLEPAVPRLDDVVARYGQKMHLFIELKAPFRSETQLQSVLHSLTPIKDYHLISLNAEVLENLTCFPNKALLLVPEHVNVSRFCRLSLANQYGGILGHYLLFTQKRIDHLRDAGQQFGVGFVDSQSSAYREMNRGIDWLFTDHAERMIRVLKR